MRWLPVAMPERDTRKSPGEPPAQVGFLSAIFLTGFASFWAVACFTQDTKQDNLG